MRNVKETPKIVENGENSVITVLAVPAGYKLYVNYLLGDSAMKIAIVEKVEGAQSVIFRQPTIVVAEGLHPNMKTCKHLRFARIDRGARLMSAPIRVTMFPRLRAALKHAGIEPVQIPGGFAEFIRGYPDEIFVPDYTMSGTRGWVVKKSEVQDILAKLPPLKDSGEIKSIWINFSGYANTPDECAIQLVGHDPSDEPAPEYMNRAAGYKEAHNHHIFRVDYDTGSMLVKKIVEASTNEEETQIVYKVRPVERRIVVGKRLPRDAAVQEF